jgi:hypothetical protein
VYLSLKPKKNAKITPILMLMLTMFSFGLGSVPKAFADIYQRYGNVGWIYPDGEAWAMVDTGADQLCFKWSFSQYIILPYIGAWFPIGYVEIYDSHGTIYFRDGKSETIHTSEELWLSYSGENVWITFKIQACYILASPVPSFLTPEISITFYIGNPPSSGGGGGCPTLFVWNGTDYTEEGVLDIHAESDVTVQHEIQNTLALENSVYKLQLRELDNFTSHIDQVKLYAIDNQGKWHLCPLTYAYHNELGKVTWKLRFDDSNRVELKPTEIIDLKFAPSRPYSETAYFIFEINGYNRKPMPL